MDEECRLPFADAIHVGGHTTSIRAGTFNSPARVGELRASSLGPRFLRGCALVCASRLCSSSSPSCRRHGALLSCFLDSSCGRRSQSVTSVAPLA